MPLWRNTLYFRSWGWCQIWWHLSNDCSQSLCDRLSPPLTPTTHTHRHLNWSDSSYFIVTRQNPGKPESSHRPECIKMSNLWTGQVPKATVDIQGEMVKHILHSMKFSSSLQNDITAASCCMRLKLIQIIGACQQLWILLTSPTSCLTYLGLNIRFIVNQWKHVYLICNMFGQCRVGPPLFSGSLNVSLNNSKLACSTTPLICNLLQM